MTIIHMRNVPGQPDMRALDIPLPLKNMDGSDGEVPIDYHWDGSSVPWLARGFFPRHRHPIASCRHDYRCEHAKTPEERLFADEEFKRDVRKTSWWITAQGGYLGTRIGAYLGSGVYHPGAGGLKTLFWRLKHN
jgi:hypothetical protein